MLFIGYDDLPQPSMKQEFLAKHTRTIFQEELRAINCALGPNLGQGFDNLTSSDFC